ncbi:MAG TPA: DUF992 domain-containing protein [Methylocella sp.]|nr:DUF992 domain-containing protein [Methylocella sp.]
MNIRKFFCAAAVGFLATIPATALAQENVKIGQLSCNVSGGLGLVVTSAKEISCIFTSVGGLSEPYFGTINKFGLDIGLTDQGVLAWTVFAPTREPPPGALAGTYSGLDASATVGVGLGANLLVGGSNDTFSLQPLSVQAQTGLSLAAGVSALTLRPGITK